MPGSMKYKTKLSQKFRLQRTPSKASLQEPQHKSPQLPLEVLDLSGRFFKEADGNQGDGSGNENEVPTTGYLGGISKSIFGQNEYAQLPEQAQARPSSRESGPMRAKSMMESRSSQGARGSASSQGTTSSSGRTSKTSQESHPLSRMASFHDSGDITSMTRSDPFRGTTPLATPLPMHYDDASSESDDDLEPMAASSVTFATPQMSAHDKRQSQNESYDGQGYRSRSQSRSPGPAATSSTRSSSTASFGPMGNRELRQVDDADIKAPLYQPRFSRSNSGDPTHSVYSGSYQNSLAKDPVADLEYVDVKALYSGDPSMSEPLAESDGYAGKYQKGLRKPRRWYGNWSTRAIILACVGIIALIGLAVGLGVGLWQNSLQNLSSGLTPTWRPALSNTWQIQLSQPLTTPPQSVSVYDLDLFDNTPDTIKNLHLMGRRVICYFSAGTYESWRPDASKFPAAALGGSLPTWQGERYVDTRDATVRAIMTSRIDLAISKGCDGVDPDNVDSYAATNTTFPLTVSTAVDYVRFLANYAHNRGMAIGLKNAAALINGTLDVVDWELNESCAQFNECDLYQPFIEAGKPVFHIEYTTGANATLLSQACNAPGTRHFSTLLKKSALDTWSMSCPFGDPSYEKY